MLWFAHRILVGVRKTERKAEPSYRMERWGSED